MATLGKDRQKRWPSKLNHSLKVADDGLNMSDENQLVAMRFIGLIRWRFSTSTGTVGGFHRLRAPFECVITRLVPLTSAARGLTRPPPFDWRILRSEAIHLWRFQLKIKSCKDVTLNQRTAQPKQLDVIFTESVINT